MCKNAFSASETTILPMWLYLLRTPVYLMSLWCAYMKLRRISNFHFKRLYLVNICVYNSFRDDFECYRKMADIAKKRGICTIISGLTDIPRFTQSSQCFSANITSTLFNVQKRIFSFWNDDVAHGIVRTAHASVLDVTLMRIYEVAQNYKFSQKICFI